MLVSCEVEIHRSTPWASDTFGLLRDPLICTAVEAYLNRLTIVRFVSFRESLTYFVVVVEAPDSLEDDLVNGWLASHLNTTLSILVSGIGRCAVNVTVST